MQVNASPPKSLQIIRENEDGSGVVRVPILKVGQVNLKKTASKGGGTWDVTLDTLHEIAANFPQHPGPVPVGTTIHRSVGETGGAMPAFLESVVVSGNTLFGDVFAMVGLFDEIKAGMWRGFSVDAAEDAAWPTITLKGWSVFGGIFTNRPAADVHFAPKAKVAASVFQSLVDEDKERDMETVSLEIHEAKIEESKAALAAKDLEIKRVNEVNADVGEKVATLQTQLDEAKRDLTTARTETSTGKAHENELSATVASLEASMAEMRGKLSAASAKLDAEVNRVTAARVKELVEIAIDPNGAAMPPKYFEGYEADPCAWLKSNYANLNAFETFVSALPGGSAKKPTSSGPSSVTGKDGSSPLSEENEKRLRRLGLKPEYDGITDENELMDRRLSDKEK